MPSRSAKSVTIGMSDFSSDQVDDCICAYKGLLADGNWSKLWTILCEIVFYKYLYFYESIDTLYRTSLNKDSYLDCIAFDKDCLIFDFLKAIITQLVPSLRGFQYTFFEKLMYFHFYSKPWRNCDVIWRHSTNYNMKIKQACYEPCCVKISPQKL